MFLNKSFIIAAFFLVCHVVPSQQLPLISALTKPIIGAGIPFSGLLDPTLSIKVIEGVMDLVKSLSSGDFLFSGIKTTELLRSILKVVNLTSFNKVDNFLEMLHGVLESVHPFMKGEDAQIVKPEVTVAGHDDIFDMVQNDKPTEIKLVSDGMKIFTSIPKMFMGGAK